MNPGAGPLGVVAGAFTSMFIAASAGTFTSYFAPFFSRSMSA